MSSTCRLFGLLLAPATTHAAFTFNDIEFWTGSGGSQAALVIDFNDGTTDRSYAWGYRFDSATPRTGADLFLSVVEADPRLTADAAVGSFGLFVNAITFDPDGTGSLVAHSQTTPPFDSEAASNPFFNYFVNNEVFNDPVDFNNNSHILPPNGEPFADTNPGSFINSSTGASGRPLADGSYDGYIFADFGTTPPTEPFAATAIPEPGSAILLLLAAPALMRRRRCA